MTSTQQEMLLSLQYMLQCEVENVLKSIQNIAIRYKGCIKKVAYINNATLVSYCPLDMMFFIKKKSSL
jgi:hypothetical protein